ncbi:MAG: hypothetical protein AAF412_00615 [Pseudomonadota bacterium]
MTQAQPPPETPATYGLTQHEIFRLTCAYTAIRKPQIRAEFLELIESWAKDQWVGRVE